MYLGCGFSIAIQNVQFNIFDNTIVPISMEFLQVKLHKGDPVLHKTLHHRHVEVHLALEVEGVHLV